MIVRRIFAATTAVFTVAGIVTACSGVPDVTFGEEDDGGSNTLPDGSSGFDTGPKIDGNVDTGTDGPTDAPICTPSNGGVEDCTDGVDNDCNGKVDCADDACNPTHACIDTPPGGWSVVDESDGTRPACPSDMPNARDVDVVAGTGAGSCSCNCTPTVPAEACNMQPSKVTISGKNTCNDAVNDVTQSINSGQTVCALLTTPIAVPNGQAFGLTAAPPKPPSGCTAATQITSVPPITAGRACAPTVTPTFGGGCGVGKVCARKAPAGLALCLQKSGASNACPGTYPTRKTAGSSDAPDGGADAGDGGSAATVDNRTCNTCTCSTPACTATATLFKNNDCSGSTTNALPTACTGSLDKNFTATSYKSTITGTGCGLGAFNTGTTGAIAFTDPTTICCP